MSPTTGRPAVLVAAGIMLSRLFGLIRQRVFGHYFGASAAADAFMAALRIPNLLQNLFGEGVLSASFIPVYAKLLAPDTEEEARRVAGAVAGLLGLVIGVLVVAGLLAAPVMVDVIAPGFAGEQRLQTIRLVRIFFPGTGLLVLSAWCLGILNSHGRFFLSYAAPVAWNLAIIAALVGFGGRVESYDLAAAAAWGAVAGSGLQFLVQLPAVLSLAGPMRITARWATEHVRTITRNFLPVFFGRGVLQISAYIDTFLGSLLPAGAVASLAYAQTLYLLPVSVFGMSVSAAELPAMSRLHGAGGPALDELRHRLVTSLSRITFFVVPSAMALLVFGDVIAATVYQSGRFTGETATYVWVILAGAAVGLLANTQGRLYASTYYALQDTRTPLRYSLVRVTLSIALGWLLAFQLPPALGLEARWGVAGITLAASLAAWLEWFLLRRGLPFELGRSRQPVRQVASTVVAALAAAALGWWLRGLTQQIHPIVRGAVVLVGFGATYVGLTWLLRVPQARGLIRKR
ncbi:MAG: murein biosynthesis integral membrane protein MurJ [Gemmatimonadales bacterium]